MGEALPFMSSPSLRQGPSSTLEMSLWVKSRQTAPSQNAALSGYKNRHFALLFPAGGPRDEWRCRGGLHGTC